MLPHLQLKLQKPSPAPATWEINFKNPQWDLWIGNNRGGALPWAAGKKGRKRWTVLKWPKSRHHNCEEMIAPVWPHQFILYHCKYGNQTWYDMMQEEVHSAIWGVFLHQKMEPKSNQASRNNCQFTGNSENRGQVKLYKEIITQMKKARYSTVIEERH